jgi:hypothetical protein
LAYYFAFNNSLENQAHSPYTIEKEWKESPSWQKTALNSNWLVTGHSKVEQLTLEGSIFIITLSVLLVNFFLTAINIIQHFILNLRPSLILNKIKTQSSNI